MPIVDFEFFNGARTRKRAVICDKGFQYIHDIIFSTRLHKPFSKYKIPIAYDTHNFDRLTFYFTGNFIIKFEVNPLWISYYLRILSCSRKRKCSIIFSALSIDLDNLE